MADLEERPSKIRKLDPAEDVSGAISSPGSSHSPMEEPQNGQDGGEAQGNGGGDQTQETPQMSKSQLKKLRKAQQWEAGREYRRLKRRDKHKAKQARKAEGRADYLAKLASGEIKPPAPQIVDSKRPRRPIQVPVSLILDCDFNDLMTEKEIISLGAQLTRSYSENKSTPYRSHFAISSWGGVLKERFETKLASQFLSWKGVRFVEGDFEEAAKELNTVMRGPQGGKLAGAIGKGDEQGQGEELQAEETRQKETNGPGTDLKEEEANKATEKLAPQPTLDSTQDFTIEPEFASTAKDPISTTTEPSLAELPPPQIVYLTSDSEHTLTSLEPNTSYIIGGIVDKNRHKGICYKRACERGIPTAKLPISEFMVMQSRSVLAVNHVVEIMLKWLETGDWGEAFMAVIPKRKEAKLRAKKGDGEGEGEDEGDNGEHNEEVSDSEDEDGEAVESSTREERSEEKDVSKDSD